METVKIWVHGFGCCFSIMSGLGFVGFLYLVYPHTVDPVSREYTSRLEALQAQIVPLSVADLGE